MIDLSQYSGTDEDVKVTFRDDTSFTGKFFLYDKMKDTYRFASKESLNRIITRNGTSIFSSYKDIVKVEPVNPKPMKIDLSEYVNKEVTVTLKNGATYTGTFSENIAYKVYRFSYVQSFNFYSFKDGTNYYQNQFYDIVKVELVNPEKPKQIPLNTLESKTLHTIASTLTPEAIKYIESHDKYAEVMVNLLEEFLEKNLGNSTGELPFMIFDRIFLNKGTN
jgi:hypothetical protein